MQPQVPSDTVFSPDEGARLLAAFEALAPALVGAGAALLIGLAIGSTPSSEIAPRAPESAVAPAPHVWRT